MLYDGAIAALQRAIRAIEAHDIEKRCAHVSRALAIIVELEGVLNFDEGGEVARNLQRFYVYARKRMLEASIQNSPEMLAVLVHHLADLREAWHQVDHLSSSMSPAPQGEQSQRNLPQDSESPSLHLLA
jgi:flagellar protein FliS